MTSRSMSELDFQNLLSIAPGPNEKLPSDLDFSFVRAYIDSADYKISSLFHLCQYTPGEVIMLEGEIGHEIYIIRNGRVAIFKGEFNEPVILGFRGTGDMIGEMAVVENKPRSASVVALDDTELITIDRDGFNQLVNQPPFLGLNMLGMFSHRLREIGETHSARAEFTRALSSQIAELEMEKRHLMEMERLRQETTDLIVHDLRNPLSSIMGGAKVLQVLMPKDLSNESRELLDIILTSAGRMQRLVDSMLEVSRIQAGESELHLNQIDVGVLAKDVTNTVLRPIKNINFSVNIEPGLPTIQADIDRLERVLANLIDNALKHSPSHGKISVEIFKEGESLQVNVIDEGPGIPFEERQRIFERFAQVAGEKKKHRGYGLGLSFCKYTIEAHGGKIWVESGPNNVGSCFSFRLPISKTPS